MPRDFKCCLKNILPRESLFWVWISIIQVCALFRIDPFLLLKQQNINQIQKCLGDNWGRYIFKLVGKVFVLYGHAQLPIFSVLLCNTVVQCMSVYVYNIWQFGQSSLQWISPFLERLSQSVYIIYFDFWIGGS